MNKILAITIVYNPNEELLIKDICSFINDVDKLLVWENTKLDSSLKNKLLCLGHIEFVGTGINKGISYALNYAHEYAKKNGYDYLLTMDQDSIFENFAKYKTATLEKQQEELCIVGPYQDCIGNKISIGLYVDFRWVITSGAIFPISLLNNIGGFQSRFFVDSIDIEVCLRARDNGYHIYICKGGKLIQNYGVLKSNCIMGRTIKYTLYSSRRTFEIFRNLTLLIFKYHTKDLFREYWSFLIMSVKASILNTENRWSILKSVASGTFQGFISKKL